MAEQESPLTLAFTITVDGQDAGTQEFEQEMVTIGKGGAAVLQINDPELADLHCAVQINDDGAVTLLDLGSEAGTLLNGEAVNNNTVVDGDEIRAGKTVIKLGLIRPEAEVDEDEEDTGPIVQPAMGLQTHPLDDLGETENVLDFVMRSGKAESDLGINRLDDGRLVGDVEFASASEKAGYITPVPGGVGPMTIAILVANTVLSAEKFSEM
jgi:hypothetical protein